jgi:hypothetical protein
MTINGIDSLFPVLAAAGSSSHDPSQTERPA